MTATVCRHNHCIHDIRFNTYDIKSRVCDISSPYMWHHNHYVCEYMSTIFNIKHRVLRQYSGYMWNHNLHICTCDHTDCIDDITHTVFMTCHLLYLCTICTVYDISPMIYDITTLYPFHQSIISHIKQIIFHNSSTVSLSSHSDYRSYNPHCMYDNTVKICMISYAYIWHHIH